ncbi:hypothetical protein [Sphingobium sp.]|uniref:hypothetical protein n=1 Tax=Sphingobium sp. TaxID=1912891 RepID=UPI0028BED0A4|nr:hypothetical protein [Sphingobium sp.]
MIWMWLGRGEAPAFHDLVFTDFLDDHVIAASMPLHCCWLSAQETFCDIFHTQIVNNDTVRASTRSHVYSSDSKRALWIEVRLC